MSYLHIEYMDGRRDVVFYDSYMGSSHLYAREGVLTLRNGNGSYMERGKVQAWPMENIRRYWTSDNEEE